MGEQKKLTPLKTVPFAGGCITGVDPTLLKSGQYSMVMNLRPLRPGFIKRKGLRKLHTEQI